MGTPFRADGIVHEMPSGYKAEMLFVISNATSESRSYSL